MQKNDNSVSTAIPEDFWSPNGSDAKFVLRVIDRQSINPQTPHEPKDQNLDPSIWENGVTSHPEVRRLRKPTPLAPAEVLARTQEICDQLNDAVNFWNENEGVDRFQKERGELLKFLSLYEARVTAARQRLRDIDNEKSSLSQHFENVSAVETATNNIAKIAQESIAEAASQATFQQPFALLDRQTQKTVMNRNPIRELQSVSNSFYQRFSRTPDADRNIGLASATIERLKQALELVASVLNKQIS
jgi:hypothetical protein